VLVGEDIETPRAVGAGDWPRWSGLRSAKRTTGVEWKRMPIGKPSARCWKVGSAVIIEGAYRVATPAVKRPCATKYCWNCSGSGSALSRSVVVLARALNSPENSRSKSISS